MLLLCAEVVPHIPDLILINGVLDIFKFHVGIFMFLSLYTCICLTFVPNALGCFWLTMFFIWYFSLLCSAGHAFKPCVSCLAFDRLPFFVRPDRDALSLCHVDYFTVKVVPMGDGWCGKWGRLTRHLVDALWVSDIMFNSCLPAQKSPISLAWK